MVGSDDSDHTYEVYRSSGGRWMVDAVFQDQGSAIQHAQILVRSSRWDGVKVVWERPGRRERVVYERSSEKATVRRVTITPIDSAPLCETWVDIYRYPARRMLGRMMRRYLDDQGLTPIELLHSYRHLRELEREGGVYIQVLGHIANLQAKANDLDLRKRTDALDRMIRQVIDASKDSMVPSDIAKMIGTKGFDAAIMAVKGAVAEELHPVGLTALVADHLGGGDWDRKLDRILAILEKGTSTEGVSLLDEAMAEVLDGAEAVREILGSQPDLGTALTQMTLLASGRLPIHTRTPDVVKRLNAALGKQALPASAKALLGRVERELNGVRPLTKESDAADLKLFLALVKDLRAPGGLLGGGPMALAVARRAAVLMSVDGRDLTLEEAFERICGLLTVPAMRLGFMVDLLGTPIAEKLSGRITADLLKLVAEAGSFAGLVPADADQAMMAAVRADLGRRLEAAAAGGGWQPGLAAELATLIGSNFKMTKKVAAKKAPQPAEERKLPERRAKKGEILFNEGDVGVEAFMIREGLVEVFVANNGSDVTIATLGRGDIVGEMSLIDDNPRAASVRVLEDVTLSVIPRDLFKGRLNRLADQDRVLRWLIEVFVTRLRGRVPTD